MKGFDAELFRQQLIAAHENPDPYYWRQFLASDVEALLAEVASANERYEDLQDENRALLDELASFENSV